MYSWITISWLRIENAYVKKNIGERLDPNRIWLIQYLSQTIN